MTLLFIDTNIPLPLRPPFQDSEGRTGRAGEGRAEESRVLTRFVLKYTLRAQAEPSGAHEAVEGGTGHARDLGDGGLGNAQFEEAPDIVLLAIEP